MIKSLVLSLVILHCLIPCLSVGEQMALALEQCNKSFVSRSPRPPPKLRVIHRTPDLPFSPKTFLEKKTDLELLSDLLDNKLPLFDPVVNVQAKTRITKKEKDFLYAFKHKHIAQIIHLVRKFSFLKSIRFTDPELLQVIPEEHHFWCPEGWSPGQIASYTKDLGLLILSLKLGMDVRTIKKVHD